MRILGISEIGNMTVNLELKDSDSNVIVEPQEISIVFSENVIMYEADGSEVYSSDGIRVISKGIVDDPEEYADYVDMILLVENTTNEKMRFAMAYDSLSFNGFMTDCYFIGRDVHPGKVAFIEISIAEEDFEANGITAIEDITEAEFGMEKK